MDGTLTEGHQVLERESERERERKREREKEKEREREREGSVPSRLVSRLWAIDIASVCVCGWVGVGVCACV